MCTPAAIAGIAVSAIGTGIAVAGQKAAADAQEQNAEANEMLALADAAAVNRDARTELFKHGLESRYSIGTIEANAAALNLDLSFGSSAAILSNRFRFSAMDSIQIAHNARSKSTALTNSAAVFKSQARNIRTAGNLSAAAGITSGLGDSLSFATGTSDSTNRLLNALNRRIV